MDRHGWSRPYAADAMPESETESIIPRTLGEMSRELRMHSRVLRWKAQRLRVKSAMLLTHKSRHPTYTEEIL
jgi:hypothetical protein